MTDDIGEGASTPFQDEADLEGLFLHHPEYALISESLSNLERQLEQAENDIRTLQSLKAQCATEGGIQRIVESLYRKKNSADDERFGTGDGFVNLPQLQKIKLIPNLDLSHYRERLPRRATSKHDQNLEFFLARIQEEQARKPHVDDEVVSLLLPPPPLEISSTPVIEESDVNDNQGNAANSPALDNPRELVRRRFYDIISATASTVALRSSSAPTTPALGDLNRVEDTVALYAPQPIKAVNFTVPFPLPSREASPLHNLRSRSVGPLSAAHIAAELSSSVAICGIQQQPEQRLGSAESPLGNIEAALEDPSKRRRRRMTERSQESSHHNLPWTIEERRRLEELLMAFPEEEVFARRCAKIAAALGTRTANQVANRLNKLHWKEKKRREALEDQLPLDVGCEEDYDDDGNSNNMSNARSTASDPTRWMTNEGDDEWLDSKVKMMPEYQAYLRMKRQVRQLDEDPTLPIHDGFRCDGCGVEPIVGPRWRCTKCREPHEVDLCEDCYQDEKLRRAPTGKSKHRPSHQYSIVKII